MSCSQDDFVLAAVLSSLLEEALPTGDYVAVAFIPYGLIIKE